jgi:hypothetical protein
MTVYSLVKKWRIDPNRAHRDLHNFAKEHKAPVSFFEIEKIKVIQEGDVKRVAAQVESADFIVYESYDVIYIYEFEI